MDFDRKASEVVCLKRGSPHKGLKEKLHSD